MYSISKEFHFSASHRLDHLPEQFSGQRVRRVCVLGRADTALADTGDVKNAAVTEIKIDRLKDEGPAEG